MSELRDRFVSNVRSAMGNSTTSDLAKKSGLSQQHLTRLLAGDLNPTLDVVENIANALGRSPVDLLL